MRGEAGHLTIRDVNEFGNRKWPQAELLQQNCERFARIERNVAVARAGIPPVQPLLIEIGGLRQRRKKKKPVVGEQLAHFRGGARGEWRVLHHFEAGDDVEASRWALVESGKWVVGCGGEALRDELTREHSVAAAEIEERDGITRCE